MSVVADHSDYIARVVASAPLPSAETRAKLNGYLGFGNRATSRPAGRSDRSRPTGSTRP